MKVKAYQLGFYDHKRRRPGDVFQIKSGEDFSFEWMMKYDAEKNAFLKLVKPEKVKEDQAEKVAKAKAAEEKAALMASAKIAEEESADAPEEPIDVAVEADSDDNVI